MANADARTVRLDNVRLAFPSLFTPKPVSRDKPNELRYQAVLLLPPEVNLTVLTAAMAAAMTKKWGKVIQLPAKNNPLHEAAEKQDYAGFLPGWKFISVKSKDRPTVVNRDAVPVTDPALVYPGMWVNAYLDCYAWEHPTGGKGISFGLMAMQLVKDDERLDGRRAATDVFQPLDALPTTGDAGGIDMNAMFG